jgi:hypothetical protein
MPQPSVLVHSKWKACKQVSIWKGSAFLTCCFGVSSGDCYLAVTGKLFSNISDTIRLNVAACTHARIARAPSNARRHLCPIRRQMHPTDPGSDAFFGGYAGRGYRGLATAGWASFWPRHVRYCCFHGGHPHTKCCVTRAGVLRSDRARFQLFGVRRYAVAGLSKSPLTYHRSIDCTCLLFR